jgi:hypothetical protein
LKFKINAPKHQEPAAATDPPSYHHGIKTIGRGGRNFWNSSLHQPKKIYIPPPLFAPLSCGIYKMISPNQTADGKPPTGNLDQEKSLDGAYMVRAGL